MKNSNEDETTTEAEKMTQQTTKHYPCLHTLEQQHSKYFFNGKNERSN